MRQRARQTPPTSTATVVFDSQNRPRRAQRATLAIEDPKSTPRKHTALGRMKHEGATVSIAADGRAVAYMGDDVSHMSCPDNVAFDPAGRLWISTDGMPGPSGINDGLFVMPVEGDDTGHVRRFASVPRGAECSGPFITPDGRTATIAVQHPGEGSGASPANPISTFPYGGQPRPSVVTAWRKSPGNGRYTEIDPQDHPQARGPGASQAPGPLRARVR